jgi:tetratricopeptide (TPR) repeat protein
MEFIKKHIIFFISAVLVVTVIAAYEPIRHNDFVNYDDYAYITENPNVNGGITSQSVIHAFTKTYLANWYPLTWLSHMIDCQLFGLNPFWHHFVSLLFHIANALLLFWVLEKISGSIWASAFAAAVFALHPVHVESVAWAAERKDVLSGFFWFLTIAAYIRYAKRPGIGRYISLFMMYALCIMTKPMVVTLPLVLLLLDYWPLGRFGVTKPTRLFIEKIPLLVLSAFLSMITFAAQQREGAVIALEKIPLDYRIANMFISYVRYTGKTLWPSALAVSYPHPNAALSDASTIICALLVIVITIFSIEIGRRRKYAAVGWLWFVGTLVPVIGLVQVGSQGMADRYMYLPMVGLLIIVAWAVRDFVAKRPRWKIVAAVSAGVVILSMVNLTRTQVKYWQNSITLFEHALKVTKGNGGAETGYGNALAEAGNFDDALRHLNNALRINPSSKTIYSLGKVCLNAGKFNEAIKCFSELINRNEGSAEVYYNLAMALAMQGRFDEAIKCFSRTLELFPEYPDVHKRIGAALLATGRTNEAIEHFNEALRANPKETVVYVSLSIAYTRSGKYEQAIQNWAKARELEPNSPYVFNNPAWLLATAGDASKEDADRAIEFARLTCEQTGYKDAELLDVLAASYAAGGKFEDAKATGEKASREAKAANKQDLADEIQERIKLYEAGKRYIRK